MKVCANTGVSLEKVCVYLKSQFISIFCVLFLLHIDDLCIKQAGSHLGLL